MIDGGSIFGGSGSGGRNGIIFRVTGVEVDEDGVPFVTVVLNATTYVG